MILTSKEFFQSVVGAERRVKAMTAQVLHMADLTTNTAVQLKTDPVLGSGGNRSEQVEIDYIDSNLNLERQIRKHSKIIHQAEQILSELPPMYDSILRYRYLCDMRWSEILPYYPRLSDIRQLYRIHGNALIAAQKILDNCNLSDNVI